VHAYDPENKYCIWNSWENTGDIISGSGTVSGNTWNWKGAGILGGKKYAIRATDVLPQDLNTDKYAFEVSTDGKIWIPVYEVRATRTKQGRHCSGTGGKAGAIPADGKLRLIFGLIKGRLRQGPAIVHASCIKLYVQYPCGPTYKTLRSAQSPHPQAGATFLRIFKDFVFACISFPPDHGFKGG
jgi:hypothetical protein